jgi:DUF1365 family protein
MDGAEWYQASLVEKFRNISINRLPRVHLRLTQSNKFGAFLVNIIRLITVLAIMRTLLMRALSLVMIVLAIHYTSQKCILKIRPKWEKHKADLYYIQQGLDVAATLCSE